VALLGWQIPGSGPAGQRATELLIAETESAGRRIGIAVTARIFADANELPAAVEAIKRDRAQALIVQVSSLTYEHRAAIMNLAAELRLPDMYEVRLLVDAGGLVSYGPDLKNYYRSAAAYVDKVLRGAAPGDLAVEQATKVEMVINLKTAKARGITIPQSVLLRADEVIQ
jgi:putative ABC transport system substrate-binding protein